MDQFPTLPAVDPEHFTLHAAVMRRQTGLTPPELLTVLHALPDYNLRNYRLSILANILPTHLENINQNVFFREEDPAVRSAFVHAYAAVYCMVNRIVPSQLAALLEQLDPPEPATETATDPPTDGRPTVEQIFDAMTDLMAQDRWTMY